ncbi:MAG: hypothetical protein AAGA35_02710 [Patescibacteria group bacterium]
MFANSTKTFFAKWLIACSIVLGLFTPIVHEQAAPKAEAIACSNCYTIAQGALAYVEQAVSAIQSTVTAVAAGNLQIKEYVLDGIAWNLAKLVIQQMTASIVDWINSGFQGEPAFVQDLDKFLLDIGDKVAGEFIRGSRLSVLCSPFELDIRIALDINVRQNDLNDQVPVCTLTDVVGNVEGFLDGTFAEGGWEGWFELTSQPQNTPYGAYLAAEVELSEIVIKSQSGQQEQLSFGDGFLAKTVCDEDDCIVSTPGKILQEATTFTLSTGERSLIEADEFNEIIAALLGQLAQQAITGANGLLGLGSNPSASYSQYQTGYTSALANDIAAGQEFGNNQFGEVLAQLNPIVTFWNNVLAREEDFQVQIDAANDEFDSCFNVTTTSLNTFVSRANNQLNVLEPSIVIIQGFEAQFNAALAAGDNEAAQQIIVDFQDLLVSQGLYQTIADAPRLQIQTRPDFDTAASQLQTQINQRVNTCEENSSGSGGNRSAGSER